MISEKMLDRREHATEACRRTGVHIYRSRDPLPNQKGAESRYLSCSIRRFPFRMFVCRIERSHGLAISSHEDLFFFSLDIDRSAIDSINLILDRRCMRSFRSVGVRTQRITA